MTSPGEVKMAKKDAVNGAMTVRAINKYLMNGLMSENLFSDYGTCVLTEN